MLGMFFCQLHTDGWTISQIYGRCCRMVDTSVHTNGHWTSPSVMFKCQLQLCIGCTSLDWRTTPHDMVLASYISYYYFFITTFLLKFLSTEKLNEAKLGVSRTIYLNVDSAFPYFLGGSSHKRTPCIFCL